MIDIHNHLIPNIDDGSTSLELSRKLLIDAINEGITGVLITPHFDKYDGYTTRKPKLEKLFEEFKLASADLKINLYLGNELYIDSKLDELLLNYEVCSLNDSKYVLVEFPFDSYKKDYDEYLYNVSLDYKIIIAHPERYKYVRNNPEFVRRWLDKGYYLQTNQASLFVKETKNIVLNYIEKGYLSFIASDAHSEHRPLTLIDAYKYVSHKFNEETANLLMNNNPLRVINNKDLLQVKPVRKHLF